MNRRYETKSKVSVNKNEVYFKKKEALSSFFLDEGYSLMTLKQVAKFFDVPKEEEYILESIISELESEGLIYSDDSKRLVRVSTSNLIKCIYEAKTPKFGFGILDDDDDIYISSNYANGAMNGDCVLVKIITANEGSSRSKEGKIIKILTRNIKKVVGKFIKSRNFGFVEPIDSKINDIYIPSKSAEKIADGTYVEVEITRYATDNTKTEGRIVSVIGSKDLPNIEVKALYKSYSLDKMENFNRLVEQEIEKIPDNVLEEEKVNRIDKTAENIFTIDSEDAKDLDDAICVKRSENGGYTLSVFIADVSHYVKNDTELNKEAVYRGTSIYVPGTVIPMLPKKLSNGICSLNAGVERLALAVDIMYDKNGEILDSNVYKSIINVKKKMTYEKVYKVISHEDEAVLKEYKPYEKDIFLMRELSLVLNKKRMDNGSINFDIPDTKVVLDEDGNVVDIKPYEVTIANKIIEEFMLAANMVIAEKFFFLDLPFIYRIHEKPEEEKLRDLNEVLSNYKKRIKGIKDIHPKALASILDEITDEEEKQVVSNFMLRTLKLARYSEECTGHFGLAAKYYCHFTSPIRRYPDLFIHRVITEYLDSGYNMEEKEISKYSKQAINYSKTSSDTEKQSTLIERDFDNLYKAIYMNKFVNEIFNAIIISNTSFGMFIKLDNTVEGLVSFDNMPDNDYYMFDEKRRILVGRKTGNTYKIGDKVKVKLVKVDIKSKEIDFKLI